MIEILYWSDGTENKFSGDSSEFVKWKFEKNPDIRLVLRLSLSREKLRELELA